MNDIEKKALALEMIGPGGIYEVNVENMSALITTLKAAIEQHEAFRQEVSDVVSGFFADDGFDRTGLLRRFIIAEPVDPLVEIVDEVARDLHITGASTLHTFRSDDFRNALREALAKRGGKIVWENSDA